MHSSVSKESFKRSKAPKPCKREKREQRTRAEELTNLKALGYPEKQWEEILKYGHPLGYFKDPPHIKLICRECLGKDCVCCHLNDGLGVAGTIPTLEEIKQHYQTEHGKKFSK